MYSVIPCDSIESHIYICIDEYYSFNKWVYMAMVYGLVFAIEAHPEYEHVKNVYQWAASVIKAFCCFKISVKNVRAIMYICLPNIRAKTWLLHLSTDWYWMMVNSMLSFTWPHFCLHIPFCTFLSAHSFVHNPFCIFLSAHFFLHISFCKIQRVINTVCVVLPSI
jgi:hypothetical protein